MVVLVVVVDAVVVVEAWVVVVGATVDDDVELEDVVGVWAGTSGGDGFDELVRTLAAAAVTPPTIKMTATAIATSLRADAPIGVRPFSRPLACHLQRCGPRWRYTHPHV
jgi:hypothetical protein